MTHSNHNTATDPLAALHALLEDDDFDLGTAALLIAAAYYPDFDLAFYLDRLDQFAEEVRVKIGRARRADKIIAAMNTYLLEEQGFRGNVEDYYHPANSFLNEVIDRRVGLPITLSILYLAIAHRLRLPMVGVGMPLHFIVKYIDRQGDIYVDPFYGGELLTAEGCRARVESIVGRPIVFDLSYLAATPERLILYRLLNNLKQVYLRREEPSRAGRVVEQMLIVAPDSVEDVRDRGVLFLQENAFTKGAEWLTRYLDLAPNAPDAGDIRSAILQAYERRASLN